MPAPEHPSLNILYSITRFMSPARMLEIGTGPGNSASAFAQALVDCGKGGTLTSVDAWVGPPGRNADEARARHEAMGIPPGTVEFVSAPSQSYLPKLAGGSIDIVFVDGNHHFAAALADIREAVRIARRLVVVHDVDQKEVYDALEESGWPWARIGLTFGVISPGHVQ